MQNLYHDLEAALQQDQAFISDGKILKNVVIEKALQLDPALLAILLGNDGLRKHFFQEVAGTVVFDKVKFQQFVSNKAFLPDSFTAFKNKIGLVSGQEYLKESNDVVLAWPYKDCVLEGGQTKDDRDRKEIFWNTTLAPDHITRIFEPKVLTSVELWDKETINADAPKVATAFPANANLLIKGNNLLTLHSLKSRFSGSVDVVYIDPPYNPPSKANTFLYNNRFNHSAWLTFMRNRIEAAKVLMKPGASMIVAIDDNEFYFLGVLLDEMFPDHEVHCITIVHNPRGVQGSNFSYTHEYAFFVIPRGKNTVGFRKISAEEIDWSNLRNWGSESERSDAKNCFFPIRVDKTTGAIIGFGDVAPDELHPEQTVDCGTFVEVYPIDKGKTERKWRYARQSVEAIQHLLRAEKRSDTHYEILLGKDFGQYKTVWQDTRYDANIYGTQLLSELVPECDFTYPKSLWTVYDCLNAIVGNKKDALVLDFFGGSGTTGHAVMELNKNDDGNRRFILTEQMDYVRRCTRDRLLAVMKRDDVASPLVYAELAEQNATLAGAVETANSAEEIAEISERLRMTGYVRPGIKLDELTSDEFAALELDQQKQILMDCLDANHFYVNYGDIDDADYGISDEDKALNRSFYEGGK